MKYLWFAAYCFFSIALINGCVDLYSTSGSIKAINGSIAQRTVEEKFLNKKLENSIKCWHKRYRVHIHPKHSFPEREHD